VSLKLRAVLVLTGVTLVTVLSFGAFAYLLFVRQQRAELHRLLDADLARARSLLTRPVLGADLLDASVPGVVLQVVSHDGTVLISWGASDVLPEAEAVRSVEIDDRTHLVRSATWGQGAATIRLAHDVEEALSARWTLARSLTAGGIATFLAVALLATVAMPWAARPLDAALTGLAAVTFTELLPEQASDTAEGVMEDLQGGTLPVTPEVPASRPDDAPAGPPSGVDPPDGTPTAPSGAGSGS